MPRVKTKKKESKKDQVIEELFKICKLKNNFVFHNNLVKDVCKKIGFGNPFDVTKLDNKTKLPDILIKSDYAIIHIGSGNHKFIKGIDKVFHNFEPIQKTIEWKYKKIIAQSIQFKREQYSFSCEQSKNFTSLSIRARHRI